MGKQKIKFLGNIRQQNQGLVGSVYFRGGYKPDIEKPRFQGAYIGGKTMEKKCKQLGIIDNTGFEKVNRVYCGGVQAQRSQQRTINTL